MLKKLFIKKDKKAHPAEKEKQDADETTKELCRIAVCILQEGNTPKEEKKLEKLQRKAERLTSFMTEFTLQPGQEEQWNRLIRKRVEALEDTSVTEKLQTLLPNVKYHPTIKKRLKKQIKKSKKKPTDKTMEYYLDTIMEGYLPKEEILVQNEYLENPKKPMDITNQVETFKHLEYCENKNEIDDEKPLPACSNAATVEETKISDLVNRAEKPILREGHEQQWIERIKPLTTKQTLDEQLGELMPLVRYHNAVKNAVKVKRKAIKNEVNHETLDMFLHGLSQMYGPTGDTVSQNKSVRCYKCCKRGHIRRCCPNKTKKRGKRKDMA